MPQKGETVERDRRDVARLLAGGASLHLLATLSAYAAGRFRVLPGLFSPAGTHGVDAGEYLGQIVALGRNPAHLFAGDAHLHVRLYALSSAVLTPVVGPNILSLWPVSVALYLLMLLLTYRLGRECFGGRAGFAAAVMAGALPSLLLHETQPLHDPLFIVLMLTLLWILVRLLGEPVGVRRAAAYGAGGCATLLFVWAVRSNWLPFYACIVALALATLLAATLKKGRAWWRARLPNFACLTLFLCALPLMYVTLYDMLPPLKPLTTVQRAGMEGYKDRQVQAGQSGLILKFNIMRQMFVIMYPEAGSNIDADRGFDDVGDIAAYLPRATLIGLFAPFPDAWLEEGASLGRSGRLIAGAEMCFIYLLWVAALACVWRSRRDARVWFLLAVVLLGAAALGLVVLNVGALYRMRFVFWIVLMVLGAGRLPRLSGPGPVPNPSHA